MTIGKFIQALRRANGMTQKELGERLFVSDKTISRWECDESLPELSLIPAIAEIFGVTTDELLRGERKNSERENGEDLPSQKAKSEKQFRTMLYNRVKKYNNLTLISVGITILGIICAAVCNIGFLKGSVGFFVAAAFIVAGEICQICFSSSARLGVYEENSEYYERILFANTGIVKTAIKVSVINIAALSFCLPLATFDYYNTGLDADTWLVYGLVFAVVSLVLSYIIYVLFIQGALIKRKIIFSNSEQTDNIKRNKKILIKTLVVSLCIAVVTSAGIFVVNTIGYDNIVEKVVFDSCDEFKEYMQTQYDTWREEGEFYDNVYVNGDYAEVVISEDEGDIDYENYYPARKTGQIVDDEGNVICEYYYNPDLYAGIYFSNPDSDAGIDFGYEASGRMPVTVVTLKAHNDALDTVRTIESVLYFLIVIDFICAACAYITAVFVIKKNRVNAKMLKRYVQ